MVEVVVVLDVEARQSSKILLVGAFLSQNFF